jgi:hypothetical protein
MLLEYTILDLEVLSLSAIQATAGVARFYLQGHLGEIIRVGFQALLARKFGVHIVVVSGKMLTDVELALEIYGMLSVDTSAPSGLDRRLMLSFGRS